MTQMSLDQFLATIQRCFKQNQSLVSYLSMNLKTALHIGSLQQEIQQLTNKQIQQKIERLNLPSASIESLIEAYIRFVRDVDPWSVLNSIDLMIDVFHSYSIALNIKSPMHLNLLLPVVYDYMDILVPMAKLVDEDSMKINNWTNDYPRLSYISNDLLKCLNNIRSDPEINQVSNKFKIKVLFDVCIQLCTIYFSIGKQILSNNVFSNINVLKLDLNFISKSQLLRYRYIVGKYHSQQANYVVAYKHLNWCYENLPPNTKFMNHIKILKYLLPVGLLVGKLPNAKYLQKLVKSSVNDSEGQAGRFFLNSMLPLITAYKHGDLQRIMSIIHSKEELWKSLELWVGLVQRIRLLVLRNAIFKAYLLNGKSLRAENVLACLRLTITNSNDALGEIYQISEVPDLDTANNILATLISNGLLKGKASGTGMIVLSKDSPFPNVSDVYFSIFKADSRENWLDKE